MASGATARANQLSRKHNNRMWAEKRRVSVGGTVQAGATGGTTPTTTILLDHSKAIYRPVGGALHVVPPGGGASVVIPFSGWESGPLTAQYHELVTNQFRNWQYDATYYVDVSIKCGLATGAAAKLHVALFKNGVLHQELICHDISTSDERHHAGVNIYVTDTDRFDLRLTDPTGVGYNLTVVEAYADFIMGNRR